MKVNNVIESLPGNVKTPEDRKCYLGSRTYALRTEPPFQCAFDLLL
jgi:hypothetical protein